MTSDLTRRDLLKQTLVAGTAVVAGLEAATSTAAPAAIPIIDTHQHLWDMKQFRPPWLGGPAEAKINRPETMSDYLKATAGLNVVKTIYMEIDAAPQQQQEEANWLAAACKKHNSPLVAGVIAGRPAHPEFAAYAKQFKGSPYIKGIRQVLQVPEAARGLCLTPEYVRNIRLCGELGLIFDICIRPEELADAVKLVDLCPHTRFVLDHCGNGSAQNPDQPQWEQDITAIGKRKNVVCKVSGVIKTVQPDWDAVQELDRIVKHVAHSFGPDRIVFGGDWPVCNKTSSIAGWVHTLKQILHDASELDKRKLFHDNAAKFYGV